MILPKETSTRLLYSQLDQFRRLNLFPVIGMEIEFYLTSIYDNLQDHFKALGVEVDKEKGENQFEVRIPHTKDILACIKEVRRLKKLLESKAKFTAKPYLNQPGNALHVHLHLENANGENLYMKQQEESELMLHSIGGLCATMAENILLFAPYEQAYLRYKGDSLESPSKICWGGNNRSAAIRIPLDNKFNRRLEHRVACADSCPQEVVLAILFGVLKGVKEKINPPEKLYGNAFLDQYELPFLPQNYTLAKGNFSKSELFKLL